MKKQNEWYCYLVCAGALTILKVQGNIFDEVVYEYNKTHNQQLL